MHFPAGLPNEQLDYPRADEQQDTNTYKSRGDRMWPDRLDQVDDPLRRKTMAIRTVRNMLDAIIAFW